MIFTAYFQNWDPKKKVDLDSLAVFDFGHFIFVYFLNMALKIWQKTCKDHNAAKFVFW
jgi:hypothetical protein